MTTGQTRASSAGMVADAFATFLDDGFRLRTDAITARRRLVASLFAVATPLVDDGGRRLTKGVGRAGSALWRGARRTEQLGATVADEAADAGREGARAVRDAATRRATPERDGEFARDRQGGGAEDDLLAADEVVEIVEVVEPGLVGVEVDGLDPVADPVEGPTAVELAAAGSPVDDVDDVDELDEEVGGWDGADDDLLDEARPADETLPEPPALLGEAAEVGGDRGDVPDAVTEEAVDRIVGDAAPAAPSARRAGRRETSPRPRAATRPTRRDRAQEERRGTASSGTRGRRD